MFAGFTQVRKVVAEMKYLIDKEMYPTNHTAYIREYNDSIKRLADKIRSGT